MNTWGEWFRANSDKILLAILFLLMAGLTLHLAHYMVDSSVVNWAREETGNILAAIMTLTAGGIIAGRKQASTDQPADPNDKEKTKI